GFIRTECINCVARGQQEWPLVPSVPHPDPFRNTFLASAISTLRAHSIVRLVPRGGLAFQFPRTSKEISIMLPVLSGLTIGCGVGFVVAFVAAVLSIVPKRKFPAVGGTLWILRPPRS